MKRKAVSEAAMTLRRLAFDRMTCPISPKPNLEKKTILGQVHLFET